MICEEVRWWYDARRASGGVECCSAVWWTRAKRNKSSSDVWVCSYCVGGKNIPGRHFGPPVAMHSGASNRRGFVRRRNSSWNSKTENIRTEAHDDPVPPPHEAQPGVGPRVEGELGRHSRAYTHCDCLGCSCKDYPTQCRPVRFPAGDRLLQGRVVVVVVAAKIAHQHVVRAVLLLLIPFENVLQAVPRVRVVEVYVGEYDEELLLEVFR